MRLIGLGAILAAGSIWGAGAAGAEVVAPPAEAPPPLSIWRPLSGATEHLQSGLVCPERIDQYKRTRLEVFDGFGLDVGCNYNTPTATITLYLTRRSGSSVEDAMAEAKRELLQLRAASHPQLVSETRSDDGALHWNTALYAEDPDLLSSIWIADLAGWTFEYRVTYPLSEEPQVLEELQRVTVLVEKSAGARLALCAKTAPPERAGKPITDANDLQQSSMMTSLLGGATLAAAADGKALPEAPKTWCVEAPITRDGHHLLYWRAVHADGADAQADRLTLMTIKAPPTLDIDPPSLIDLLSEEKDKHRGARWTATLQQGEQTMIFGYFEGRPSPDLAADLFAGVIAGKARPLGSFGVKGKAINITLPPGP